MYGEKLWKMIHEPYNTNMKEVLLSIFLITFYLIQKFSMTNLDLHLFWPILAGGDFLNYLSMYFYGQ